MSLNDFLFFLNPDLINLLDSIQLIIKYLQQYIILKNNKLNTYDCRF
jgi:hypothetical protein